MAETIETGIGEQIERLVEEAQSTAVLSQSFEPSGYYYLTGPDGKATLIQAKPAWHKESLESPDEMNKFIAQRLKATALKNPAVFYGSSLVQVVYDIDDRRDFANCALIPSTQYKTLMESSGKPMPQKAFINLLRVVFRGCMNDGNLLNLLRSVQWSVNENGNSAVQQGKESIGRQIVSQVQGVDVIPEELILDIPIYENHKFRARVVCAIDVIVESRAFSITPYPQELRNAMELTLDDILVGLTQEGFPPAFRGTV